MLQTRGRYVLVLLGILMGLQVTASLFAQQPRIPQIFRTPGQLGSLQRGDPEKGKEIYKSQSCANCHSLNGRGQNLGPDLGRDGKFKIDPDRLRKYLADPRSIYRTSVKAPLKLSEEDMDHLIAYLLSLERLRISPR